MDTEEYLQQCAQEDQARLDEYVTSRPVDDSSSTNATFIDDDEACSSRDNPPQSFNVSTRLIWNCAIPDCKTSNNLTSCPFCEAVQYCSQEHRLLDRPGHRSTCTKIKKARATYQKEEKALRRRLGDSILDTEWGLFWRMNEAHQYMHHRRSLVEMLLKFNTAQAVTLASDHLFDILKLWRSDELGARDVLPALLLRLGKVQEAYDFCLWWATIGHQDYDWRDVRAPYLDIKDADVFGKVEVFAGRRSRRLSHLLVVTLLKIKLMIDIHSVQRARDFAGPYVPREILDTIQQYSMNSVVANSSRFIKGNDQELYIARLRKQIRYLYTTVDQYNPHFWPALIEPGEHLTARPTFHIPGNESEMHIVLQHNYNAWSETRGAISIIEELSKSTASS